MTDISHEHILAMGRYRDLSIDGVDPDLLLELYIFMVRLRHCQEAIAREYHPADEMRCPVHFCIGQEAVPAALAALIQEKDFLLSHHRSHGYYLARGGAMDGLLAELHGRQTGANGGLAGSQEISCPSLSFYSGAIISGMLAIAVGVGLGFQLKELPNVAIAAFGDGAVEEGVFWEAISYSKLHNLPVLFICENNGYSTYSALGKRQPADDIHHRVAGFGIESRALFGNDVVKDYFALREALDYARERKGPFFVEAYTYRWMGHVGPEDDDYIGYRPKEELKAWKQNCPIRLLEEQMMKGGLLSEEQKKNILLDIDREISDSFTFALGSAFPSETSLEDLNYCKETPLADKLLKDCEEPEAFDFGQKEAVPEPY
ncbi:MAG: thiamine pyrophosphate-dependent dehydrogenase E1 component subunit alpha [Proteobacteria bacterium]|nr:thiamine pyrophosphate-dependent dehydrogenase E1 component subunit alpha [Pseudomonadota bacterium]